MWQWPEPPADKLALLRQFDGMSGLRGALSELAVDRDHWAGIPMPLDHERLVIEPNYPNAAKLMAIGAKPVEPIPEGFKIRNSFWSTKLSSTITVVEHEGKIRYAVDPGVHHLGHDISTLGCSDAWGLEQERAALQTLGELVPHRQLKQYLLTGMFMETSKRSRLTYLFRKLRPTVVLDTKGPEVTVRCCLCLHPIAFYAGSWAGAMTPTDDVIAHLMMMRGDEPMFWRRSNQHPPWRPEAGL